MATPSYKIEKDLPFQIEEFEGKFDPMHVRFLVYGESGSGKTVFASSWPNPIFLDIDKGMSSITKPGVHRIEIGRLGESGPQAWEELQNACSWLAQMDHPYKTVVLDSLNEAQYICMQNVVSGFPGIRRSYENLPSQSDYGKMLDDFDKMVRFLKTIPLNIVMIAQVKNQEYETDLITPQLTGKNTASNICRAVDVVGYLSKIDSSDPVKPRVMTFDATTYVTKDRSGKLPQSVMNPTYDILLKYWTGKMVRDQ